MTDVKHDIDALAGERWFPLETTITEDMSSIWGDWGVCSEVDKLKAVPLLFEKLKDGGTLGQSVPKSEEEKKEEN